MKELIDGFMAIPRAFELLGSKKIGKYIFISGVFGLIIGVALSLAIYAYYDDIGSWLEALYPFEWGSSIVSAISKWLVLLLAFLIVAFSFKYIMIILLSPILSYISEAIEEKLTGEPAQPFNIKKLFYEMGRSIRINVRNIFKEFIYTILLLLLSLTPIPGVRLITTPAILSIQAYYMGFGNLDFLLERHYNYKQSLQFVKRYRMMAIGNGLGFLLLFAIPILGFVLAPTLSVIGATVEGLERMDEFDAENELY